MKRKALGKGLGALIPTKEEKLHCGHPSRSKRLNKTLYAMKVLRNLTTIELQKITSGVKVSTDIDDLRRAGYPISNAIFVHTTDEGRKVYRYEWLKKRVKA